MIELGEYFNYAVPMTGEQMIKYQTNLTAVSLFAGVGGFDLAMERNGINVVASVEIDKHAAGILAKRFPKSTIMNDVRNVTKEALQDAGFIPEHGIITGGFPCQDLSNAGKRAGLAGARSGLFYEIARIADETKAKWLVLENVPGLLTSQRGADMGAVIGTLVDLGYGVAWRVLDAQHFGVPQRRRRVFIVAERSGDPARAAQVLFERQSLRRNPATSGAPRQETPGLVGSSIEEPTLYDPHHGDGRATTGIANTLAARMGTGGNNTPVPVTATNRMTAIGQYAEDDDSASTLMARDYKDAKDLVTESSVKPVMERTITHEVIGTLQSRMHKGVNHKGARDGHLIIETSLTLVEPQVFVKAKRAQNDQDDETWKTDAPHPTLNQFDQGDSRTVTAVVAPTLTAYNMDSRSPQSEESQRIVGTVHAVTGTVRRLTPTECERLQGFPDGWTEGQADSHRYKQMGNAVAVPVVEWIMQGIVEVMSDERK